MEFLKFDSSLKHSNGGHSIRTISMSVKSGVVSLSKAAGEAMGVQEGSKLALFQDPETPENWFLAEDEDGFITKEKDGALKFNCVGLVKAVFNAFAYDEDETIASVTYKIAAEPEEHDGKDYWPILTAGAKMTHAKG